MHKHWVLLVSYGMVYKYRVFGKSLYLHASRQAWSKLFSSFFIKTKCSHHWYQLFASIARSRPEKRIWPCRLSDSLKFQQRLGEHPPSHRVIVARVCLWVSRRGKVGWCNILFVWWMRARLNPSCVICSTLDLELWDLALFTSVSIGAALRAAPIERRALYNFHLRFWWCYDFLPE
jgi:hypothetical protein